MKSNHVKTIIFFLLFPFAIFSQQPVKLVDSGNLVTLSNSKIQIVINKSKTLIQSIRYKNAELIGKQHVNWNIVSSADDESKIRRFSENVIYSVRIDPSKNNGERAEISFKFIYDGNVQSNPLDIDIRYSLGRNDNGVYLSALISHKKYYPETELGQGRMIVVLNPDVFDFYTVDSLRRRVMASAFDVQNGLRRNVKEANLLTTGVRKGQVEHKYDYSAMLAQTPAWGWTSTKKNIGIWMINPSHEYMNGGPTQVGNTGHVEAILLNHWHDGHYGGGKLSFQQNEDWQKFIGPFYLYCNTGPSHDAMWKDAINEASEQQKKWPFEWVIDKEYPQKAERSVLKGRIIIMDPDSAKVNYSTMWVGLAATENTDSMSIEKNWQYKGKKYQFWVKANNKGEFSIPAIRTGKYELYAFVDGILGEYKKTDIFIRKASVQDIGTCVWQPLRYGNKIWEIGIADRSAAEFKHGDNYWQWGLYMLYPTEFPNDVNFTIGKSNWKTDWNYCQPPVIDSAYNVVRKPTWTITFDRNEQVIGKATLRIAICGSRNQTAVNVYVNDVLIGNTGILPEMGVMHRDGIRGKEEEIALQFDAELLKKGSNTIKLKLINVKNWTYGILYDYLRLEIDEKKQTAI